MAGIVYITGGARSGKSAFALQQAEKHDGPLLYVATAAVRDREMADRVDRHRQARGERWQTLEEPILLAEKIPLVAKPGSVILVDCLTLWLSNLLENFGDDEKLILQQAKELVSSMRKLDATIYIVSNEVGGGIVPENDLARKFRDLAGLLNQNIAAASDEAWQVVSGLPLKLK